MSRQPDTNFYRTLVARAAGLRERTDAPHHFIFEQANPQDLERRIKTWREATGERELFFQNRLLNDGFELDQLDRILGNVTIDRDEDLPGWSATFRNITDFVADYDLNNLDDDISALFHDAKRKEIPFVDLLTPVVLYASLKVDQAAGEEKQRLFSTEALQMLHSQLAGILSFYTSQTFHLEFQVFRSTRQSALFRVFAAAGSDEETDTTLYREFAGKYLTTGWSGFFEEYSVLARVISILTENWITNTTHFMMRLNADYQDITERFAGGTRPGRLTGYKGGISDVHDHGKSVISLRFESGLKLIYKPKNLELEQAWSDFLTWFNDHGLKPDLKPLDLMVRGKYGWVGFIEADPCSDLNEVADYYRRIGSLVAIIYLLNGNDCHHENLIASGAYPVIIDLESIMHHEGKPFVDEGIDSAIFLANSQFGASVFRTGILPAWITGKDGYVFDVSGIGGYGHKETPYQRMQWKNLNTDRMDFTLVPITYQELPNIPLLGGEKQLPVPFLEEIVSGFTVTYDLLLQFRDEIPVWLFEGKEVRFIFRATRIYGLIMKKLMNPRYMRTGIDRSIQLELLCRAFLHTEAPNPYWNICKSELRQMEGMDFPIFWADAQSTDLKDNTGVIVNDYMTRTAYGKVIENLHELDQEDLHKQVKFIRASLFFRDVAHGETTGEVSGPGTGNMAGQEASAGEPATIPENTTNYAELTVKLVAGAGGEDKSFHDDQTGKQINVTGELTGRDDPSGEPVTRGGGLTSTSPENDSVCFDEKGELLVGESKRRILLDQAMKIAGILQREAIFSKDGSCSWISVGIIPGTEKFRMHPMSLFLYDGLAGVALFLTALCKITGDTAACRLNEATLRSLYRGINTYDQVAGLSDLSLTGIGSGFSSLIYSLFKISGFLDDHSHLEQAVRLSQKINPVMTGKDQHYDILSGSAGALLAMLALFRATGDRQALGKAVMFGNHLLKSATENSDGSVGWKNMQGKMLTGFSHGAGGVAYSLFRLYEATGEQKYFAVADKAIRYENSQYSAKDRNWYDLRDLPGMEEKTPRFMQSWCHGAPGISLGRLAVLHLYDNDQVRNDIATALDTTLKTGEMNADHLCCGNLGRAEIILTHALANRDADLANAAYARILQSIRRAGNRGHFTLFHKDNGDFFNPGFFQGLSGIGYEMLRLAYPDSVPSILVFE